MAQKVLIADDDATFSEMLKTFLETKGYEVWRVGDASALAARLKLGPLPELLILDMQMPGGGGPGAVKNLRQDAATAALPILICSGMPEKHQADWFKGQKAMRFCTKQSSPDEILKNVKALLP